MSVGWIAGAIRGKALAGRCLGPAATTDLAARGTLQEALHTLADSTYGHRMKADMDLESAQHAVSATALWHLRVLAGWLPPRGVDVVRTLAAWFEADDIAEFAVAISGDHLRTSASFALGPLATLGDRAERATSLAELRNVLAHSEWGDPAGDSLDDILLGLRLGWGRLLGRAFRDRPEWGAGELALSAAGALFLRGAAGPGLVPERLPQLGSRWKGARSVGEFAARLPDDARWVLRGVDDSEGLWQAEHIWWARVESDAAALVKNRALGRATVVGAAVMLLADSWRVRTALATAYRGGSGPRGLHGQG